MDKKGYRKSEPRDYHHSHLRTRIYPVNTQVQRGAKYIFLILHFFVLKRFQSYGKIEGVL